MAVLPPRPYRVEESDLRAGRLAALVFAAMGLALLGWCTVTAVRDGLAISADQALWARGVAASNVHVRVSKDALTWHADVVDVDYLDGAGALTFGRARLALLGKSLSAMATPVVKYDPADSRRFVLSWAVELASARWKASALLGLLAVIGVLAMVGARQLRRRGRLLRAVAEHSEELHLELVGIKPVRIGRQRLNQVSFRYTHAGTTRVLTQDFPVDDPPMFADSERRSVVALVAPSIPARPFVVSENLAPFHVPSPSGFSRDWADLPRR